MCKRSTSSLRALTLIGFFWCLVLPSLAQDDVAQDASADRPPAASGNPHGELSVPCSDCHTTEGWYPLADPLPFDHAETGFPLVASHRGVACLDCHRDLRFGWVASSCADCHRDPHQGELGLSCSTCHDTRGWQEAQREMRERHAASLFPLTGAHAGLDCASCHRGTAPHEFSLAPTDCFSCHVDDYQRARDPNHVASGFPTTCESCHITDDWRPADFRAHDSLFFPIFSGEHEGAWNACSDCHVAPASFAVFSCFNCHPRRETDDEHDDVNGYRYESNACYACHPDGRE